ncbi:chaplin family protein [Actinomadura macrotermitis]|uniref:Chaplin domain-containing protein n=1 Tax=Actinomadura macrotermitis TaxID=2585200 RepID=A0A7K0BXI1_9ACTN|nr:chaplin family protein [Actinomadura macrotermitis]MQY05891.1 hypothetical protein [Actinomadura macrotermitis]
MRTWVSGTARAALLTAGFVALGASATPAFADGQHTSGANGVLSGNQINAPISIPVNACGNAVAILGMAKAGCEGGATVHGGGGGGQKNSGKNGDLSGNQVNAPVGVPVNVCGNAVAILGLAKAGCEGGADVHNGGHGGQTNNGKNGVGSGNQVNAPISVPVNVCGNAVAILGLAKAGCVGGASVHNGGGGGGQKNSGTNGVVSGNQVNLPVGVPVNVCGNAAAVLGKAAAGCVGGADVHNGGHGPGGHPAPKPHHPKPKPHHGKPGHHHGKPGHHCDEHRAASRRAATPVPVRGGDDDGVPVLSGVKVPALSKPPVTGNVKAPEIGGLPAMRPVAAATPMQEEKGVLWIAAAAALSAMTGAFGLSRRFRRR